MRHRIAAPPVPHAAAVHIDPSPSALYTPATKTAQILKPTAAPEGSEIKHRIHRSTRKRESESISPSVSFLGAGPRPQGGESRP